ncbi:hypothetical protein [Halotia branconii]|uniref:Uncharacterized protein n=1 Tax=Halotia branconii CENA392 TaxID=1539056 RepID=A0AAJ6NZ80_9CYAN|nr:hypothetical protein [Halotia branconii]WGV29229.1 hypothetical protein QI031_30910 [Halotia branconii CENA392]
MDSEQDFLFCNERIADRFNPFYEGEYLIIQTYPSEKKLVINKRCLNYESAKDHCNLENLAHDYTSFAVRIFHEGRLWDIDFLGNPSRLSKQQDWKIVQEYLDVDYDGETNEALICSCSYPYIERLINDRWSSFTSLFDDKGRSIEYCPNCNVTLIEQVDCDGDFSFYEQPRPVSCVGCDNYHGQFYGENLLTCAIHPHGWNDDICPDFFN